MPAQFVWKKRRREDEMEKGGKEAGPAKCSNRTDKVRGEKEERERRICRTAYRLLAFLSQFCCLSLSLLETCADP